ncbi:MAG: hypothetical protein WAM74_05495, partial [Xanthobacteraceae bacterium]
FSLGEAFSSASGSSTHGAAFTMALTFVRHLLQLYQQTAPRDMRLTLRAGECYEISKLAAVFAGRCARSGA